MFFDKILLALVAVKTATADPFCAFASTCASHTPHGDTHHTRRLCLETLYSAKHASPRHTQQHTTTHKNTQQHTKNHSCAQQSKAAHKKPPQHTTAKNYTQQTDQPTDTTKNKEEKRAEYDPL